MCVCVCVCVCVCDLTNEGSAYFLETMTFIYSSLQRFPGGAVWAFVNKAILTSLEQCELYRKVCFALSIYLQSVTSCAL